MDTWNFEHLPADQQAAEVVRIYNEEASRMFQITPIDPDKILRELVERVILANRAHAQSHIHTISTVYGEIKDLGDGRYLYPVSPDEVGRVGSTYIGVSTDHKD